MSSQKSSSPVAPIAKEPKRKRGIARVAMLLDAGAVVFAEQGYKAATMTGIAARAGAPIGSLYQFFPNKDLLADALVARYAEHLATELEAIRQAAPQLHADGLSARLLEMFMAHASERSLVLSLLDARWEQPGVRPGVLRASLRQQIVSILAAWRPSLAEEERQAMAAVVLEAMKTMAQFHQEGRFPGKSLAIEHWRRWVGTYLADMAG
ncbi:TetR/AcrR family transcriptional regulator [Rhizobium sp. 18065]|uniref:TetR/AcrR family transcriptional regulator n=1 Tax=Rhizobium sp. 18065 TaxID=2681411 RepID=UPI00135A9084|nr:TetR/AcrR family transcriptional regulator [Rhizobium sp. 18065]